MSELMPREGYLLAEISQLRRRLADAETQLIAKEGRDIREQNAFGLGCMTRALGKPIADGGQYGYQARTFLGDAFERGWLFADGTLRTP